MHKLIWVVLNEIFETCTSLPAQTVALCNAGSIKGYKMPKSHVHEQTNRYRSRSCCLCSIVYSRCKIGRLLAEQQDPLAELPLHQACYLQSLHCK